MSVEDARRVYLWRAAHPSHRGWHQQMIEAASIALDLAVAASLAGPCPRWRGRQEVIWEDRLCKALLAEVAW